MQRLDFTVEKVLTEDSKEKWITVKGTHVLIKKGQSIKESIDRQFGKKKKEGKVESKVRKKEIKILNADLKQLKKSMMKARKEKRKEDLTFLHKEIDRKQKQLDELMFQKLDFTHLDFTMEYVGKLTEDISLDECVSAKMSKMYHEGEDKKLTQEQMLGKAFGICRGKNDFTIDFIDSSQLKKSTTDSYSNDFTVYHGSLTREGPFDYKKNGKTITVYKDYDNLSELFSKADYFPLKAISGIGSHYTTVKGFTTNFQLEDKPKEGNKYRHVYGDVVVLNDLFGSPEAIDLKDYHVSFGFKDHFVGDQQIIDYFDHLAMSDYELGRCITGGGSACTVKKKVHDQNLNEVGT